MVIPLAVNCAACIMSTFRGHISVILFRIQKGYQRRCCHSGDQLSKSPKMSTRGYEEAVAQLNKLQSNAKAIEDALKTRNVTAPLMYTKASNYLHALGIEQKQLTSLRVIHVSGTKGKGSTCAYTESILRAYGYRTGFYSSPHLVAVRERIRIDGKPISKEIFAKHFWDTFDLLSNLEKRSGEKIPMYFAFLTMMAFKVFLHEKVHVAIIEVGIGGEYDWTNVVDQPSVTGITSLGLDHTKLLGNTLGQIAWHKAGIMKFLVPTFTVNHSAEATEVLQKKAIERRCHLYTVPSLQLYDTNNISVRLGIPGKVQLENASLAVQLAHFWIKKNDPLRYPQVEWGVTLHENMWQFSYTETSRKLARPFPLPSETIEGLVSCRWPGRCQLLKQQNCTYFLDGAHTLESMEECARWFERSHRSNKDLAILLFHCTGDRSGETLLSCLKHIDFDIAIFTPTRISVRPELSGDNSSFTVNIERELQKCNTDKEIFLRLRDDQKDVITRISSCVEDAIKEVRSIARKQLSIVQNQQQLEGSGKVSILVTGSLHLVGNVLSILDPESD